MDKSLADKSIGKSRLHLNLADTLFYFKVPILLLVAGFASLSNGFQTVSLTMSDSQFRIGLILLALSVGAFFNKNNRLTLLIVNSPVHDFRDRILNLALTRKWEIEKVSDYELIFKTIPIRGYHEYNSYNKDAGERIYVFINNKTVYIKSIDNLDNITFKLGLGENRANEKLIATTIKPAANTR